MGHPRLCKFLGIPAAGERAEKQEANFMNEQKSSYVFALSAVVLWSTVASAFKLSLRYLTPVQLLFYSSLTSCLVLFIIVLLQGKGRQLGSLGKKDWLISIQLGFLNPFLYYVVLFYAYDLLPAQQAQALNYTWAITLSLLAVPLLGQKIRLLDLIAIAVSYLGVVVISTRGELLALKFDSPTGVGLALFSTLIWALYWIANTKDHREPVIGLLLNFICSVPMVAAYLFITKGWGMRFEGVLGAIYVGIFEMGVTYVFWLMALKRAKNTARIANLIFISPFLSLVLIHFLVGEEILRSTIIGLVFIICGLSLQSAGKKG
jgi:drug/metabolite transporter (DMT)-like permease